VFRMALQTLKRESCLGWMRREILGGDLHASIIGTVGEGIGGTASGCRLCPVPRYLGTVVGHRHYLCSTKGLYSTEVL
jgi:hypothetical protein